MALLSVDVVAGSVGVGFGRSGGNPGGTVGEMMGMQDTLILQISLMQALIRLKYPSNTSSK